MKKYLTLAYVWMLCLTACGSSSNTPTPSATPTTTTATTVDCSADKRVTAYADNMNIKGPGYTVQLLTASPEPPATGLNTWTFKVQDANGTAVSDANVTIVPWMPDHGHGPSVVPQVGVAGGVYTATNVDLFMAGVWELTFAINGTTANDEAVVYFCVPG